MLRDAHQNSSLLSNSLRNLIFFLIFLFDFNLGIAHAASPDINTQLQKLFNTSSLKDDGVAVLDLNSNNYVFTRNADKALKPASILKILTSVAAFEILGTDFHFTTEAYGELNQGIVDKLYIKGGGDPGFSVESALVFARELRKRGVKKIDSIVIDNSGFLDANERQGARAFQTGSAAFSFNYNSIGFKVCANAEAGKPALVSPDPWESGVELIGKVQTIAKGEGRVAIDDNGSTPEKLRFQVGGTISLSDKCVTLYRSAPNPPALFMALFPQLLKSSGIDFRGPTSTGRVPPNITLLYAQPSESLSRIIQDLNHFSNNFIAEQILFALDEAVQKSREVGLNRLKNFVAGLVPEHGTLELYDGSGLSHKNLVSSRVLVEVLRHAYKHPKIASEFISSLSIAGQNGTLKRRSFKGDFVILRAKTGSLDGVTTLAGYLFTRSGHTYAFALIQNGVSSRDAAWNVEEKLIEVLSNA